MIIFGTEQYFRTRKVTQFGFCPACSRFGKMRSFNAMLFLHLYFVPVIPLGNRKRTHKSCAGCQHGQIFELTPFDTIIEGLKEQSADAVLALKNGETTFECQDPAVGPIECLSFLMEAADWLFAANDVEFCQDLLSQLKDPHCQFAQAMFRGTLEMFQGKVDESLSSLSEASQFNPSSFRPHQLRSQLLGARKKYPESIAACKAAIAAGPPEAEYQLRLDLADILVAAKLFTEAECQF